MVRERLRHGLPGLPLLPLVLLPLLIPPAFASSRAAYLRENEVLSIALVVAGIAIVPIWIFLLKGFFMVAPNEAKVMQLFGDYVGTAKTTGLRWANPFFRKRKISLRVRNFESSQLKVNDQDGNPIDIAAVVVWRVVETAEALFEVDDYENYVRVQSEAALRNAATSYPYDSHEEHIVSLRGIDGLSRRALEEGGAAATEKAGVEVLEARFSHMAYAQEIAAAMLQRQQAGRDHRGPEADRGRRSGDGGDGPRTALTQGHRASGRGTEGGHGQQSPRRAVRREGGPADPEHRDDSPVRSGSPWRNGNPSSFASTRRCSRAFSAGQTMICAA